MSGNVERAVGYIRVSSEDQATQGISLDAQESRVRMYASLRGLDLISVYREEGVSAKIPLRKRSQGAELVETLYRKRARHVIAVKLDRLFRNAADALNQTEQWDRAKCALHVIDMGGSAVDTASAMGRMFFTMAAAFAEMERNLTSERTKAALRHKKAVNEVYCRVTPLGFDRQGDNLVHKATEMATVDRIKLMREQGVTLRSIAAILNRDGTPTKRGGRWHLVTVQKVLRIHGT
jgi:site-specific DNA recombinase